MGGGLEHLHKLFDIRVDEKYDSTDLRMSNRGLRDARTMKLHIQWLVYITPTAVTRVVCSLLLAKHLLQKVSNSQNNRDVSFSLSFHVHVHCHY